MSRSNPGALSQPILTIGLAILILLPAFVFIGFRLAQAGDGTRLNYLIPPTPHGLPLGRLTLEAASPPEETILLEINSRPLNALLVDLLPGQTRGPIISPGGPLVYTILRMGKHAQVPFRLAQSNLSAALLEDWSFYLFLVFQLGVSLLTFFRRPRLPAARGYLLLSSAIFASGLIFFLGLQASDLLHPATFWLWFWGSVPLYGLLSAGMVHFALLFPHPRPILRKRPWSLLLFYLLVWLPYLLLIAAQWSVYTSPNQRLQLVVAGTRLMTLTAFPLAILIALYSYRRQFNTVEKRQTRWVLWGALIAIVPWLLVNVLTAILGFGSLTDFPLIGVLWWAIPVTFAIAILRENLFDIDTLINRTIVYGIVVALLALVYFGSVLALQNLLLAVSGQGSSLAIVISTLGIAALFTPLRNRTQRIIDRRFYRQKYDAEKTLTEFSTRTRDEVDLDQLSQALLQAVDETLKPQEAKLWLKAPGERREGHS